MAKEYRKLIGRAHDRPEARKLISEIKYNGMALRIYLIRKGNITSIVLARKSGPSYIYGISLISFQAERKWWTGSIREEGEPRKSMIPILNKTSPKALLLIACYSNWFLDPIKMIRKPHLDDTVMDKRGEFRWRLKQYNLVCYE